MFQSKTVFFLHARFSNQIKNIRRGRCQPADPQSLRDEQDQKSRLLQILQEAAFPVVQSTKTSPAMSLHNEQECNAHWWNIPFYYECKWAKLLTASQLLPWFQCSVFPESSRNVLSMSWRCVKPPPVRGSHLPRRYRRSRWRRWSCWWPGWAWALASGPLSSAPSLWWTLGQCAEGLQGLSGETRHMALYTDRLQCQTGQNWIRTQSKEVH